MRQTAQKAPPASLPNRGADLIAVSQAFRAVALHVPVATACYLRLITGRFLYFLRNMKFKRKRMKKHGNTILDCYL